MGITFDISNPERRLVTLDGRLDTAGVGEVELQFNAVTAAAGTDSIADLSGVTFLASMAIRMLVAAARTLAGKQRRLVLVVPEGPVAETLRHGGIDQMMTVVPTMAEAEAAFGVA